MNPPNLKYALLAELLRTLEAEGFAFGVDKHLQLQQLLSQLPEDFSTEQLKQSLAPAIATNPQEQDFFYLLFDQAWERVQAVNNTEIVAANKPKESADRWILPTIGLLVLLSLPLLWLILNPPVEEVPERIVKPFFAYPDSTYVICLEEELLEEIQPLKAAYFCSNAERSDSTALGKFTLTDSLCLQYTANETSVQDSICVQYISEDFDTLSIFFKPQITQVPTEIAEDTASIVAPRTALFDYKDYPMPTDILSLKTPELSDIQTFYLQHYRKLKLLFALLAVLLTLLILLQRARKRRQLIAELEERTNPPFIWNIETPDEPKVDVGLGFGTLLNSLRKRTESDYQVFDAEKTITSTVEQGGMIDFQYVAQTRPPEYLLLLDRESGDSHRTRFYDYLYYRFLENEVFIHRYFYDNDLRRAWNEQHTNGLSLKELGRLHPDARLIIVGNAYQLLSPLSGKLAKWAKVLTQWKDRALLTYIPSSQWGRRETQLGKELVVLPASVQCLHFLLDQWDQGEEAEFEKWCDVVDDAPAHPILWQGDLISSLRQYYPPEMLRWIAACAIYPSLHWDTTLFIAEQISTPEYPLLSLNNLQKLHRLDWFVQGEIPKEARVELLSWLETTHPETLQQTREDLYELLKQNPPPKDSVAFEDYKMQRDLNEWLLTADRRRKRELENEIANQLEQGIEADYTVLKYLDRPKTGLDFIVPDAWKKHVYKGGLKGLGLRNIQRDLMWAVPILLTVLVIAYLWSPNMLQCEGEERVFPLAQEVASYEGMEGTVYDVAFSPDGKMVLAGEDRGIARLWDRETGQLIRSFSGHDGTIRAVAFSEAGVFTAGTDASIILWDAATGTQIRRFEGHNSWVTDIAVEYGNPTELFASVSSDNSLKIWDISTGEAVKTLDLHSRPISAISISRYNDNIATGGRDGRVFWLEDGTETTNLVYEGEAAIEALAFSNERARLVFADAAGNVRLLNAPDRTLEVIAQVPEPSSIKFSRDDEKIIVGTKSGLVYLFDLSTLKLENTFKAYDYTVNSIQYSPDGTYILTAGQNQPKLWRLDLHCCINSPSNQILFNEHLARKAIQQKQLEQADSIIRQTRAIYASEYYEQGSRLAVPAIESQYEAFYKNLAIDYWDAAIPFHQVAVQISNPSDSTYLRNQDSSCLYFQYAYDLDSTEVDIRRARQFCENGNFQAYFELSPEDCCAPCPVTFSNYSLGANRVEWQFGDGQFSREEAPTHRYNSAGEYDIKLTIFAANNDTTSFTRRLSICTGRVTPPPRTSTKPNAPNSVEEAVDSSAIETPETGIPNANTLDAAARFDFQWLVPQQDLTTTQELYTISIDVISNRSLRAGNLGMYYNGELLQPQQQVVFGDTNPKQQSVARQIYTYRQELRLQEANNVFQLVILNEKGDIIARSEERQIRLEVKTGDGNAWPPVYLELPYLENFQKYENEAYDNIIQYLQNNSSIRDARSTYLVLIQQLASEIDSGRQFDCTISIRDLSSKYYGNTRDRVASFYMNLISRSIQNQLKKNANYYTDDAISFTYTPLGESKAAPSKIEKDATAVLLFEERTTEVGKQKK